MPELPEVETIRRDLQSALCGQRLERVQVLERRLLQNCSKRGLSEATRGQTLQEVGRRGKFLLLNFGKHCAVVHLRMSGWFSLEPGTHTRMVMTFSSRMLYFDDTRRFGTLHLIQTKELERSAPLKGLGLEPLAAEFTTQALRALCATARPIKQLLLDQAKVAGIGNIYACEALHRAGVHPLTPARALSSAKLEALRDAIAGILNEAIESHGSTLGDSVGDYRTLEGAQGSFQDRFAVYGREDQPCLKCNSPIRRVVQAQRSTYLCPRCQRRLG